MLRLHPVILCDDDGLRLSLHGSICTFPSGLDPSTFGTLLLHKTVFMETGLTDWTAFTDVTLKRKDDVFLAAKFTDKTSGKTEFTALHVLERSLDHGSGLDHQLTLLHLRQVVHGEQVELLRQVNGKTLKLFIRPETERHRG